MANGHDNTFSASLVDSSACGPDTGSADFDAFFRKQYEALVLFLRSRSRTEEDAKDAAQESLTRLVCHYGNLPPAQWKPVLYRIAVNVAHDRLRQARRNSADLHVSLEGLEIEDDQPSTEEAAARAQQDALLRDAILALPPKCRNVYLLKRLHGLTNVQVAQRCGISLRAVEKHFTNAVAHLSRRFGQLPPGTF